MPQWLHDDIMPNRDKKMFAVLYIPGIHGLHGLLDEMLDLNFLGLVALHNKFGHQVPDADSSTKPMADRLDLLIV
jgi:hypothetical protein